MLKLKGEAMEKFARILEIGQQTANLGFQVSAHGYAVPSNAVPANATPLGAPKGAALPKPTQ